LSIVQLFNHRTPDDLASGQMQFNMLVRGQIHRKANRIFLIFEPSLQASGSSARDES
jgi:hypothetical protein